MNRREVMKLAAGLPLLHRRGTEQVHRYGFVDVPRHVTLRGQGVWLRVFLNGVDVTNRCVSADDVAGYAHLQKHRNGECYIDREGELAMETVEGWVQFRRAQPWAGGV